MTQIARLTSDAELVGKLAAASRQVDWTPMAGLEPVTGPDEISATVDDRSLHVPHPRIESERTGRSLRIRGCILRVAVAPNGRSVGSRGCGTVRVERRA